jgi:N6-adenosine-specific RNA methylase IME4
MAISNFPTKTYDVIYADPPWHFGSKFKVGTAGKEQQSLQEFQYPTMSDLELKTFFENQVAKLPNENAVMIMWTTDAHLPLAIELGHLAGFTYKTVAFIWNKKTSTNKQVCFMGTWTMKGSEIALLFTKGSAHKLLKARNVRQLVEAERKKHSQKPQEVRTRIETMFPDVSRIELFARDHYEGWDVWGNEI